MDQFELVQGLQLLRDSLLDRGATEAATAADVVLASVAFPFLDSIRVDRLEA